MRLISALLGTALAALALTVQAGGAASGPILTARPDPVGFGETLVVKGRKWPVIEFCERTVRLKLRSAQNAFAIGQVRTRLSGRFRFEYKVRRAVVGAGKWRVVARMMCESGEDGSPNPVRRSVPIVIE